MERRKRYSFISSKGLECDCGCEQIIKEVRSQTLKEVAERVVEKNNEVVKDVLALLEEELKT